MNNRQVAENWRLQTGRGKNGSNFYYRGKTIYSYGEHFPIAYITGEKLNDQDIILFNSDNYSNSTSKHIGHTRAQTYQDQVIKISTPLLKEIIWDYNFNGNMSKANYKLAVQEIKDRIEHNIGKEARARKHKDIYRRAIDKDREQLTILGRLKRVDANLPF